MLSLANYEEYLCNRLQPLGRDRRVAFAALCLERLLSESHDYILRKSGAEAIQQVKDLLTVTWDSILAGSRPPLDRCRAFESGVGAISWDDMAAVDAGQEAIDQCAIETIRCATTVLQLLRSDDAPLAAKCGFCVISKVDSDILWNDRAPDDEGSFGHPKMADEVEKQRRILTDLDTGQPLSMAFRHDHLA